MPRILVADDNSNIHRTIALALKDAGVEVVAVGNGEAAVRKIAEINPDLVLADIFMPVRNGYEVCEFVKHDPRFSGVPVVLLIGAFDPFDEREAQRVQADGILKKPFVPPDALVRTVTDLLAQSAQRPPATPAASSAAKTERPASVPPAASEPPVYMDAPPEEFATPRAKVEWDASEQPVAFGSLLETPPGELDESTVTAHRDPTLGEPAFWAPNRNAQDSGEAEGEESQESDHGLVDLEQWGAAGEIAKASGPAHAIAPIESLIEEPEQPLDLPQAAASLELASETVSPAIEDAAPEPLDFPALEEPPAYEVPQLPERDSVSDVSLSDAALPALSTFTSSRAEEKLKAQEDQEDTVHDIEDFSWAAPPEPVSEAVPEIAESKLSDEEPLEPASVNFETFAPFLATLASKAAKEAAVPEGKPEFDEMPSLSDDAPPRMDTTRAVAQLVPAATAVARLDPAEIEAVAQRVIERMQPQIIDLVTRELLRPVVEALVQRELEKK